MPKRPRVRMPLPFRWRSVPSRRCRIFPTRKRAARAESSKCGFWRTTNRSACPSPELSGFLKNPSLRPSANFLERVKKFLRADASGAEFADHDAGSNIREHGSVCERRPGCNGESQNAQDGVTRSRDIKDLTSGGTALDPRLPDTGVGNFKTRSGNMQMARRRFLKYAHPFFAARDHHRAAAEMREQRVAGLFNRFFVGERTRDVEARFLGVAHDSPRAAIRVQPGSFRLHENGNVQLMGCAQNSVGKIVSDQAFVVIGKHQCVKFL